MNFFLLKTVSIFFIFLFSFECYSQLTDNKYRDILISEPAFNEAFIKQNKIHTLKISLSTKPDNKGIDDKGLCTYFEFDSAGRVISSYTIFIKAIWKNGGAVPPGFEKAKKIKDVETNQENLYLYDTTFTMVMYKTNSILKRNFTGDFCNTWYYELDEKGIVKRQSNYRENNAGTSRADFKSGVQNILSDEYFEYEQAATTQIKKKCLNDEKRIYKEVIMNYDSKKNVISESHQFAVGWMMQESAWKYNEKGWLVEKTSTSNSNGDLQEKTIYEYDTKGNVLVEKKYKNNVQTDELNNLYDESTKLLKSQLNRLPGGNKIDIVKYVYTFY